MHWIQCQELPSSPWALNRLGVHVRTQGSERASTFPQDAQQGAKAGTTSRLPQSSALEKSTCPAPSAVLGSALSSPVPPTLARAPDTGRCGSS